MELEFVNGNQEENFVRWILLEMLELTTNSMWNEIIINHIGDKQFQLQKQKSNQTLRQNFTTVWEKLAWTERKKNYNKY
jgi:hypothetical protein